MYIETMSGMSRVDVNKQSLLLTDFRCKKKQVIDQMSRSDKVSFGSNDENDDGKVVSLYGNDDKSKLRKLYDKAHKENRFIIGVVAGAILGLATAMYTSQKVEKEKTDRLEESYEVLSKKLSGLEGVESKTENVVGDERKEFILETLDTKIALNPENGHLYLSVPVAKNPWMKIYPDKSEK